MIANAYLDEWQQVVPWSNIKMIEQDLIISRLLVELFNHPKISESLAFRGGTAIYKLFSPSPIRYSEDIDLVQIKSEPIGETITAIRSIVDPLLGEPERKRSKKTFTLTYDILAEGTTELQKLKIEINTREHFSVFGLQQKDFSVKSQWFSGSSKILSYEFDELLGTKIRAFYQRDKGRDLFDLWFALQQEHFDAKKAVTAFIEYTKKENKNITRAMFEMNFSEKLNAGSFSQDISPLLAPGIKWDFEKATVEVFEKIIPLLPGKKWKS
ncbi:MAG TPA: nucleotidyl transferase AbiEii/AbiGii toxin family protein [Gammaproteobacteria bacterium]|jgi:predicted nucleotidyltransferase component of viral defense system|nr:nucleotidyl transferase AbiEii/AbiGii toxin family protein [Gammaproteobacteria bacterium]